MPPAKKKTSKISARIFRSDLFRFLEQFTRTRSSAASWHEDLQLDMLVPMADLARLRWNAREGFLAAVGRWYAGNKRPSRGGHFDFGSQGRFGDGDRHDGVEIIAAPIEKCVRLNVGDDLQSPGGAPFVPAFHLPTRARAIRSLGGNATSIVSTRRISPPLRAALYFERVGAAACADRWIAFRLPAGLRHLSRTAACRAALRLPDASRAMAIRAGVEARDGKLLHGSVHGFPERDFDLVFQARARLRIRRGRFGRRCTAAKILAEKIAETGARAATAAASSKIKSAEIEIYVIAVRGTRRSARARSFKTKLIVHLPLLGVGEDVVRFLHLLEFFFRRFVARVQVRMIFSGKLPVGLPDLLLRRLAGDAEQLVVVLFCRSGHKLVTGDRYLVTRPPKTCRFVGRGFSRDIQGA